MKAEINQLQEMKQNLLKECEEETKKRKRGEKAVIDLRKEVEDLRNWKERNQE